MRNIGYDDGQDDRRRQRGNILYNVARHRAYSIISTKQPDSKSKADA